MIKTEAAKLTRRQREVLTTLARRLSNNEIARLLHIAEATTNIDWKNFFRHMPPPKRRFLDRKVRPLNYSLSSALASLGSDLTLADHFSCRALVPFLAASPFAVSKDAGLEVIPPAFTALRC